MTHLRRGMLARLSDIAAAVDEINWDNDLLYVEGSRSSWSPESRCAVIPWDPYEEGPMEIAIDEVALGYALAGFQVLDVYRNLDSPTPERFVAAIRHYHEFDGFLP